MIRQLKESLKANNYNEAVYLVSSFFGILWLSAGTEGRSELQPRNLSVLLKYSSPLTTVAALLKPFSLKVPRAHYQIQWLPFTLNPGWPSCSMCCFILLFCLWISAAPLFQDLLLLPPPFYSAVCFYWVIFLYPLHYVFPRILSSLYFKHSPLKHSHSLSLHYKPSLFGWHDPLPDKSIIRMFCFSLSAGLQTCVPNTTWIALRYLACKSLKVMHHSVFSPSHTQGLLSTA